MYRRPRAARPEQQIQRAVFEHLAIRAASTVFAFHPANGGWRSRVEAAILKGMGVRAGVPDIIAIKGGQCYALELKASDGRLTPVQRDAHAALVAAGARSPGWRRGACCAARARDVVLRRPRAGPRDGRWCLSRRAGCGNPGDTQLHRLAVPQHPFEKATVISAPIAEHGD